MEIRGGIEISDEDAVEYDRLIDEAAYYDRLQYVKKIQQNAAYGCLGNFWFRFFDLRLSQSTTGTGRAILEHMGAQTALVLDGKYDMHSESIVYGDSVGKDSIIQLEDRRKVPIEDIFTNIDNTIESKEYCHPTDISVLTYDEHSKELCYRRVLYVMRHQVSKPVYTVSFSDNTSIIVTEDHSLIEYTKHGMIEVRPTDIEIGNTMFLSSTSNIITATSVTLTEYSDPVYDISVEGTHTFFANGVLVHNTDSIYFKTHAGETGNASTYDQVIDEAVLIADEIGKIADKSFDKFCKDAFCIQPEYDGIIACDREVVAKRGIFVTKKRYVLKLVDLDGYRVDKLKAMGLEMKKTTTPKPIQKFLEDVVNMVLDGNDSWDVIDDFIIDYRAQVSHIMPTFDIGLPKGVKNVESYTDAHNRGIGPDGKLARLPGHVAASINYNECLTKFKDLDSEPIRSGSKIKVFYITQKYGRFTSIAIPTDSGTMPPWFDEHFEVDKVKHELRLIDKNLEKIFNAIDRVVPTAQSKSNNNLMEF